MRRKDFWPLSKADKLLNEFIPNLCHEADGLILQAYEVRQGCRLHDAHTCAIVRMDLMLYTVS